MGKQNNIHEKGNLSGLPFTFNEEVKKIFENMIKRFVSGYKTTLKIITHYTNNFYKAEKILSNLNFRNFLFSK